MKLLKRLLSGAAALLLLTGVGNAAFAKESPYTYTVRIYSGQQGTIQGGDVMTYSNLPYGTRINFNNGLVSLNDNAKYYVKGIRESGKDNDTVDTAGRGAASFLVTCDQDFVVAYAMLGNAVAYTVNYQDAEGNELAPSETYYGNIGDKPVIAYLYIEGYQPQAYNLTKTLSENAAENVFTFRYSSIGAAEPPTEVVTVPGAVVPPAAGTEETPPVTINENPVPLAPPEEGEDPNVPNLVDIDDPQVPLSGLDENLDSLMSDGVMFWRNIPIWTKITASVLLLGTVAAVLWLLLFHRRKKEEQQ